jgi:membrane fusion protein, multidrug efflux system
MSKGHTKPTEEAATTPAGSSRTRPIVFSIAALALIVAGVFGYRHLSFYLTHEETDDAQVEGHISPVLPRVPGYVARVLVRDNEPVTAGQVLVEIDPRELDLHVAEAEAALKTSQSDQHTAMTARKAADAARATAAANVETASVREHKAAHDLERDTRLFSTGAITNSQLNDTQAAADIARSALTASQSELRTAEVQVQLAKDRAVAAEARVTEARSAADLARLQRSYASVTAPIAGVVSRKNVEPGQYVQAGQTLMSIASDTDLWVVANFKETQLGRMRVGQPVEFEADTYPGFTFHGKIESIAGATGARFALLPPDNSTGNFVKVTQRVPVKIILTDAPDASHPLRPGVSVDATVALRE